tara:strand:- start:89 stop:274 length:186 start_codon:yes stop_codon:yes gene_type:complete
METMMDILFTFEYMIWTLLVMMVMGGGLLLRELRALRKTIGSWIDYSKSRHSPDSVYKNDE